MAAVSISPTNATIASGAPTLITSVTIAGAVAVVSDLLTQLTEGILRLPLTVPAAPLVLSPSLRAFIVPWYVPAAGEAWPSAVELASWWKMLGVIIAVISAALIVVCLVEANGWSRSDGQTISGAAHRILALRFVVLAAWTLGCSLLYVHFVGYQGR